MKRTGKLLESALDLLEALRPPLTLVRNEVARQERTKVSGAWPGRLCLWGRGPPQSRPCASRTLALVRATPFSSSGVEPRVTRRVCPPRSYCTIQLREPPSRRRSPKPPISSSQKVLSFVPGGSASVLAAVVVSFMGSPAWAGHGHVRPALSCRLLLSLHSSYTKPSRVVYKLLHPPARYCGIPTRTVLNRGRSTQVNGSPRQRQPNDRSFIGLTRSRQPRASVRSPTQR